MIFEKIETMSSISKQKEIKETKKERRRVGSESESDRKRSKFNLRLEKTSANGNKTLNAAGAGLKWLFSRKKSKSKEPNFEVEDNVSNNSSSFVNPIPIVAAAAGGHSSFSLETLPSEEMSERDDFVEYDEILETRSMQELSTSGRSRRTSRDEREKDENQSQQQRLVSVPRPLPHERIAYGFDNDPHLHNFHLQGSQSHLPGRKMIFRPSSYPNIAQNSPQIQHQQLQIHQNNANYSHSPYRHAPRGPVLAHVRGPFPPPPRLIHPNNSNFNHNINHQLRQPQQRSPRPRGPTQNYNYIGHYPSSNFPSHPPNLLRQPLSCNNDNFPHANSYSRQQQVQKSIIHAQQQNIRIGTQDMASHENKMSYLKPPVPKQRKSLMKHNHHDHVQSDQGPPWIIVPKDHQLPRLPVPIGESHQRQSVIENMKNLSSSCTSLSNASNNNRKSSTHSTNSKMKDSCGGSAIPWFRWFASRLEKDGENIKSGINSNEKRSDGSSNTNCIRCNKKLPDSTKGLKGVINAPVACSVCSLKVCKSCAVWDQSKNSYSCGHCHPPLSVKSLDKRKNFWFDNISPGSGTNFASAERDKVTENVREHLETIIESQVGQGIDTVPLARLFDHSQYDLVFHRFHEELSDALVNLGFSVKLAIENKPMNETPTSAHATLTELLSDIKEVAMELPVMEPMNKTEAVVAMSQQKDEFGKIIQPSYEEILSTAVINKAIINGQKLRKVDSPMSLVDSAVQTDSEMSESSEVNSHKNQYNVRGWVTNLEKTPPQNHPNLSDDDLSMGTSSSNWSNEANMQNGHQVVIEEQVEEITTTYESDSDMSRHPPVRNRKGRKTARQRNNESVSNTNTVNDDTLLGVDLTSFDSRVPFPEGGVDIVPRSKLNVENDVENDDDPTGILVSQISEWEQNWLFKRRKQLLRRRNLMAESVPMLVPNPNDDGIEPFIGEEKISDLSDLSDHINDDEDFDYTEPEDSETEEANEATATKTVIGSNEALKTTVKQDPVVLTNEIVSSKPLSISNNRRPSDASTASVNDSPLEDTPKASLSRNTARKTIPKKIETPSIKLLTQPSDIQVPSGKTARFPCIVAEGSPECSVAWFFDGQLITAKEGKYWVYSCRQNEHHLFIYDCNDKDSGKYHIALFDYKGNATKYHFNLLITESVGSKLQSPTFTFLQDTVSACQSDPVIMIPFELTGNPEPFLQVFRNEVEISKLSHVSLEDKGNGKWSLELRKKETDFSVYGEYVAVSKNTQGVTRVTFRILEKAATNSTDIPQPENIKPETMMVVRKISNNGLMNGKSPSPTPRPVSAASEGSSIGETMRENSYTLNRNQTLIKEDYEADLLDSQKEFDPSKMTIAEREKEKWKHPINLKNNPYAPENLAKRIRQRENGGFKLPPSASGDLSVTSSDDERGPIAERSQSLTKFSRDYYVHGVSNQQPLKVKSSNGPNFGSLRSLSLTSNSSREGSNEKDIGGSLASKPIINSTNISRAHSNGNISKKPIDFGSKMKEGNVESLEQNGVRPKNSIVVSQLEQVSSSRQNGNKLESGFSPEVESRTPSPRQRRYNSDLGSLSTPREGAELKQIGLLPSVKRLAEKFQVAEDKPQQVPEVKPSNGHFAKVFHKEPNKNYQQPKPRRPSDLAFTVVHKPRSSTGHSPQRTEETEELKRQAELEEHERQTKLEEVQRQADLEKVQRQAEQEKVQRQTELEEFQRQAELEEFQRQAELEEFQRQVELEEFQRQAEQEEHKRQTEWEKVQRQAELEEHRRQTKLEKVQRQEELEKVQRQEELEKVQRQAEQEVVTQKLQSVEPEVLNTSDARNPHIHADDETPKPINENPISKPMYLIVKDSHFNKSIDVEDHNIDKELIGSEFDQSAEDMSKSSEVPLTPAESDRFDFSTPFEIIDDSYTGPPESALIESESEADQVDAERPPPLPVTPPPLPMSPPPPKTPVSDDNESTFSLLDYDTKPAYSPDTIEFMSVPVSSKPEWRFNNPTSLITTQTTDEFPVFQNINYNIAPYEPLNLPLIPMNLVTSTPSLDSPESFEFEILPNPSADPSFYKDEHRDSMDGENLHAELVKIKDSNVPQPLYKIFNEIPVSKSNTERNEPEKVPKNKELSEVIDITPRNPLLKSTDLEKSKGQQEPEIVKIDAKCNSTRSNNEMNNIVARLEANQGTLDGSKTLPRIRTIDEDEYLKQVKERKKRQEEEKAQSLRLPCRRPTAMEVLATPTAKEAKEEDDVDLLKLRRSILRGARSREGLKGIQETIVDESKNYHRAQSLPGDDFRSIPNQRPRSLITTKSEDSGLMESSALEGKQY